MNEITEPRGAEEVSSLELAAEARAGAGRTKSFSTRRLLNRLADGLGAMHVAERDALRELETTLTPFAAFAEALNEEVPDDIALAIFANGATRFGPNGGACVGDLRRVRVLLGRGMAGAPATDAQAPAGEALHAISFDDGYLCYGGAPVAEPLPAGEFPCRDEDISDADHDAETARVVGLIAQLAEARRQDASLVNDELFALRRENRRLTEANAEQAKALAGCRRSLVEQARARADPLMPRLTEEVLAELRGDSEASYAMAETEQERIVAHGLALLCDWQDRARADAARENAVSQQ